MLNLAEYRNHPAGLADFLPWAALVEKGVVLNKDGSFQRTARFRGPDLDSATPAELVGVTARLNNALRRLGSGWAIFVEAQRIAALGSLAQGKLLQHGNDEVGAVDLEVGPQRLAGVGANALHHGAQAVGALRRQVIAEAEFVEHGRGVGRKNFLGRAARIKRQQDRNQSAHDMGVAVAQVFQQCFAGIAAFEALGEPNLAGATLHLVGGRMLGFRHRFERPAEFDDIPVTVVPIFQQLEIFPDLVNRRHDRAQPSKPYIGLKAAESDIVRSKRMFPFSRALP